MPRPEQIGPGPIEMYGVRYYDLGRLPRDRSVVRGQAAVVGHQHHTRHNHKHRSNSDSKVYSEHNTPEISVSRRVKDISDQLILAPRGMHPRRLRRGRQSPASHSASASSLSESVDSSRAGSADSVSSIGRVNNLDFLSGFVGQITRLEKLILKLQTNQESSNNLRFFLQRCNSMTDKKGFWHSVKNTLLDKLVTLDSQVGYNSMSEEDEAISLYLPVSPRISLYLPVSP